MAAFHSHKVQLPLHSARRIIQHALSEARGRDLKPMTVVVLDGGGHLIAMEREDGAGIARFDVARGKAWAALGVGSPSATFGAANSDRPAFLATVAAATDGRVVPVAGGVLVVDDADAIIGAIGVSGDASEADEAVAVAGTEAAGHRVGTSN